MRSLQCIAYRTQDIWRAICLDLEFAVQGDSLNDVRVMLVDAIQSHVEQVMTLDEPARSRLLNRSVPLQVRAKFAIRLFLATLFDRRQSKAVIRFPASCPV